MLLGLEAIDKRIGERTLFSGVDLQVRAGDRIGLVGPNGAGKSTLIRIAAGDEAADGGRVTRARGLRLGVLRQEVDPRAGHSVREEAATALAHLADLERELRELERSMAAASGGAPVSEDLAERYDRAHAAFEHGGGFARESRIEAVLEGLGFDAAARSRPLRTFSGGWLMRVELAKLLLSEPDVMLLDEPTNHLDLPAIEWFEESLRTYRGGVVVVSHDRTFLRRHVGRVAELDGLGRFRLYEGGYDRYLVDRETHRATLLANKRKQDREIAQTERFIERFRAKASKAKQVQSRLKALDKIERVELEPSGGRRLRLRIPAPPRAGAIVMTLSEVHKSYGETQVYTGVDLRIARGDRIALVGPNGAGKSTLLRILAGTIPIDRGERIPGHNVQVAFFAQHQLEVLDPERSVLEELGADTLDQGVPRLRGHLGAFLFSGDDVDKKVKVLSGGEKARLALAKLLLRPANFLVLDEPTNHLDVEACEVLERALCDYAGTLAFISHDRSLIDALATKVVEIRSGNIREYLGNYHSYLEQLGASTAPGASNPTVAVDRPKPDHQLQRERRKTRERTARRIAKLEEEILAREEEIAALGWQLGDPEIHRDADRSRELGARRETLQGEIDARYRDWERLARELEVLDESIL